MVSISSLLRPARESDPLSGLREAIARQPEARSLRTWLDLATGEMTELEYYSLLYSKDEITYLTVDTTGVCDLRCPGMCYYHADIDTKMEHVPFQDLQNAILDSRDLGMAALVVGGKEPFLNHKRLFEILDYAGSIRSGKFAVGLISNGRNVQRNWRSLQNAVAAGHLDFMDISIDSGVPEQHDAIRGVPGTYSIASVAVRNAAQEFPSLRVGISSVLRPDNSDGLIELLMQMAPHIHNFCVQPIQPPPFSSVLSLPSVKVTEFLWRVVKILETELTGAELEYLVMLHGPYVADAVSAGLFEWNDVQENSEGQIFASRSIGTNKIYYNLMLLPDYGWKQARINYRGDYLSHAHFLQTPDPSKYAVGNIREERVPILLRRAKERSQLAYLMLESRINHECRGRPCWTSCFGGWTVTENEFLQGRSLSMQPSACRKTAGCF